jgi:hypothetical protein
MLEIDEIVEQFEEIVENLSPAERNAVLINTRHFVLSLKEFTPVLIEGVSESLREMSERLGTAIEEELDEDLEN